MIGQDYSKKKSAVLRVVDRYLARNEDNGVELDQCLEEVKSGKYILAVVGETKAGKSTLINALLGERILPTDVLQSSSVIVEIFKSDKKFVKVTYADGQCKTVYDDLSTPDVDEALECLRRVGAIQERFRHIPASLIDTFIVQGRIKEGSIPIADLEKGSTLSLGDKEGLIKDYVKERSLKDIPVKVEVGFPLKYAFDEFRLVDSPGVNAVGGVQNRTYEFLHNANAILFLHSLEGPIEASSFREFIENTASNRMKEALFLVLSKSGSKSEIEIEDKINEARKLYRDHFDPERVLAIDSMMKIVADDLKHFACIDAMRDHYKDRRIFFVNRCKSERCEDDRDNAVTFFEKLKLLNHATDSLEDPSDREAALAKLLELSNFKHLEKLLHDFTAQAPNLQLAGLLLSVSLGYENRKDAYEQDIQYLTVKLKSPQAFEHKISEHRRHLAEYQLALNEFTDMIHGKYTGVNAESRPQLQQLKSQYLESVNRASTGDAITKFITDFNDESGQLVDQVAERITRDFVDELNRLGEEFKAEHGLVMPKLDVVGIEEKAKSESYRIEKVKVADNTAIGAAGGGIAGALLGGGIGFLIGGPVGAAIGAGIGGAGGAGGGLLVVEDEYEEREVFDDKRYIENLRSEANAVIQKVVATTVPNLLSNLVHAHIATFKASVHKLISSRETELAKLLNEKADNERIRRGIASHKEEIIVIDTELDHIQEMLEELR